MKKYLFLLATALMLFASCEGPAGRDGLNGRDGKDVVYYIDNFTVKSSDWKHIDNSKYVDIYQHIVDVDIRDDIYEKGLVNVYMFLMIDNNEVQVLLPYWVQHTVGDNTWIEGYNYDFDKGTVSFYVECEKGTTPPDCEFRVVSSL